MKTTEVTKGIKNTCPEMIELVKASFPGYEVAFTKCGNIKIVNPLTCICKSGYYHDCKKWYVIGKGWGGYWIRRVKYDLYNKSTNSTFPLHYDRNTGHYWFETFEEALTYLLNRKNNKQIDL